MYLRHSRQLYIHRNTLVYRLDKLQKSTGLDLRVFEDAITFKIALMVVKYIELYGEKLRLQRRKTGGNGRKSLFPLLVLHTKVLTDRFWSC